MKHVILDLAVGIVAGFAFLQACDAQSRVPCPDPCVNPYAVLPSLPTGPGYVPRPIAPPMPYRPYQPPTVYVPPSGQIQCQTIDGITYCTK